MLTTSSLVLWSIIVTPIAYILYSIIAFIVDLRRRGKAVDKFPGEPKHWLWGHLHLYPGANDKGLEWMRQCSSKFPRAYAFWVGPFWCQVVVHHIDTLKSILKTSEPKPINLGAYGFGKPWIGDGLLLSQGSKWSRNRRLLTPAFHFDILKPYMKINNECADILVDKIAKYTADGSSFEFFGNISLYTFDVILRCAMSYESDVQAKGEDHPYVLSVNRLGDIWVNRVLTPWKHFKPLFYLSKEGREFKRHCDYVHTVSEEVITKRKKTLAEASGKEKSKRYLDFLDILLEAKDSDGKGLTFGEIRDEVDTFMFEGHDTTSSGISWTLYSLAEHPEIQAQCQQEIDDVLQGRDSDDITWDDLPKLKYLTQCIKEGMRMHCPVPFISRALTKDMIIDGRPLPKGSIVDIQIYNLHHNPTIWEDNMEFRPSRFEPQNIEKMDSFAYVPFSAGPRNCIGQNFAMHEMKTILARLLRRFNITVDPDFKVAKKIGVVMKTVDGMKLKVEKRIPN